MSLSNELNEADTRATYCEGKIRFDNKAAANTVATKSRGRHESKLQTYNCPCCSGWHIGMTMRRKNSMKNVRKRTFGRIK